MKSRSLWGAGTKVLLPWQRLALTALNLALMLTDNLNLADPGQSSGDPKAFLGWRCASSSAALSGEGKVERQLPFGRSVSRTDSTIAPLLRWPCHPLLCALRRYIWCGWSCSPPLMRSDGEKGLWRGWMKRWVHVEKGCGVYVIRPTATV